MKKNEKGVTAKNVALGIVVVIIVLIFVGGIFVGTWFFSGGFGGRISTIGVKYEANTYFTPQEGLTVKSGSEFEVKNIFGGDYDVKIKADASANDFELLVDGEVHYWSDYADTDFTDGFTVTKSEYGFKIEYEKFSEIAGAVKGGLVMAAETVTGDIFRLEVSAHNSTLRLNFGIGEIPHEAPGDGVHLNEEYIRF